MRFSFLQLLSKFAQRLTILVALLAVIGLFVFVRPPSDVHQGRDTLLIWHATGADETEPQVPKWFNESQDKVHLSPVGLPMMEIEQKFLTSVVGKKPPDLFEYFGSVVQWSTRGALLPLNEFMERDGFDRSKIFPALWDEMTLDGRIYAIPTGTACDAFYWNKKHFREAGLDPERPPLTWAELEEYAEKLTLRTPDGSISRPGYIPGYWSAFPIPLFADWPLQKGARYLSDDGHKVTLTSRACIDALAFEGRIFEKLGRDDLIRVRASFGYGAQHGFISGQLSMIAQKSSFVQDLAKFAPDMDYGVSMLPVPEGGQPASMTGPVWIGIPAGSKHPEEAWEYIKYYTSTATQLRNAAWQVDHNLASFFPANIEAARSPKQMSLPFMDIFIKSMDFAQSSTVVPLAHSVFWREYPNAWDKVMRGVQTPEAALAEAERQIQKALDDQLAYSDFYLNYLNTHNE